MKVKSKKDDGLPTISPDHLEQDEGGQLNNFIPNRGHHSLPVVGIGGSGGSNHAVQNTFEAVLRHAAR